MPKYEWNVGGCSMADEGSGNRAVASWSAQHFHSSPAFFFFFLLLLLFPAMHVFFFLPSNRLNIAYVP